MPSEPLVLSVVIPIHDEEPNILRLAAELEAALDPGEEWECLWVDDGSTDGSRRLLLELAARNPRHRVLAFDRCRGQTAAMRSGMEAARGEFIGGLDGDGQNDPADLPRLLEHLTRHDLDMVNGVRAERRDSRVRRVSSRIANGFRNWTTGDAITDVGCSLRVFRRRFVAAIPPCRGMHRFLPTFVRLEAGRIGELPVAHRPRVAGRTKYGINNRLWSGLADTLAVRWMTRRWIRSDGAPPVPAPAAGFGVMALLALALGLGFLFQGSRGLYEPDEGRYAEAAREMVDSGDWLVPRLNGEPHFTKPPLTYWSIAVPLALFGRNEWSVRLYLAASYTLTVLLVAALGRRIWNRRAGNWAGAVYATSLLPFTAANVATPDTLLVVWETAALYAFWRGFTAETDRERRLWPILGGAAFGLAFLTKGPPGLLFLPALWLFRCLPAGRRPGAAAVLTPAGTLVMAVIGLSWFAAVIIRQPDLAGFFLGTEVVGRIAGVHHRNSAWYGALAIYGPTFLLGALPWLGLWPALFRRARAGSWREFLRRLPHRRAALLLALTLVVPLLVFTMARSRLPLYVLPLFVPLALATGRVAEGVLARYRWKPAAIGWVAALLMLKLAAAHWDTPLDARRLHRGLPPADGAEVVVLDSRPHYGLEFYEDREVEFVGWTESSRPRRVGLADEIREEAAEGRHPHLFVLKARDLSRLRGLMSKAGIAPRAETTVGGYAVVRTAGDRVGSAFSR